MSTSMYDYPSMLRELKTFVIGEAENQKAELQRQWSQPLSQRVSSGKAIVGLSVVQASYEGKIHLRCKTNNSRFREGDILVLHRGAPLDDQALSVTIEEDNGPDLLVTFEDGDFHLLGQHPDGWIADEGMLDLSGFYLEAIDQTAETERGRQTILPMLSNQRGPNIDFGSYEFAQQAGRQLGLDPSQAEAMAEGYATDLAHLIQGPPGAGKTYVLAQLVRLFVRDGLRVFITALTHRAINNALEKIRNLDNSLAVCKIGRPERARDLNAENYEYFFRSGLEDQDGGYAIGATPFATRTRRLGNVEFDVVIFDESSQVTLPLALMGMLPAAKYIYIGDQCQLPPVTKTKSSEIGRFSIFEYLRGRGYESMLTTTYRLNKELAAWPSRTFYHGRLQPEPKAATRKFAFTPAASRWQAALGPLDSAIFIDLGHHSTTTQSKEEAVVICEIITDLLYAGMDPGEIGVVVPYRAQARLIRNLMRDSNTAIETQKALVIDTVERMQGQEKELILFSLTTSEPGFAAQLGEFFFQPQRLNVSITRPRSKLIIVGSSRVTKAYSDEPEINRCIELFAEMLSNCKTIKPA